MNQSTRRWLPVAAIVAALLVFGWVVSSVQLSSVESPPSEDQMDDPTDDPESFESTENSPSPVPDRSGRSDDLLGELPNWLLTALLILILLAVAAVLIAWLMYSLQAWLGKPPANSGAIVSQAAEQPSAEELREALQSGLADIDAGGDPRKAVIACWLRMEHAAAAAGVARMPSETPADLVRRVLESYRVNDQALKALADAYRQARYAPHDVTDALPRAARQALTEVDSQLANFVVAGRDGR